MKINEQKLKNLIAGSELEDTKGDWISGVFEVKNILRIRFTIYKVGADFIYINCMGFTCAYWFYNLEIKDNEDGCELLFYGKDNEFLGMVSLKNIYLEYESDDDEYGLDV